MRPAVIFAGIAALILLFTWLTLQNCNAERQSAQLALQELDHFAALQSALQRDVLRARSGMLRNYDPLVNELRQLDRALSRIRANAKSEPERLAIERLTALLSQQETLIEQFKSQNSLLQNSLAYFGLFTSRLGGSAQPELSDAVSGLATAMLHLTLDAPGALDEVQASLRKLSAVDITGEFSTEVRAVIAHASLLQALLPGTDTVLSALYAIPQNRVWNDVRKLVVARQDRTETVAQRSRALLSGVSLVLIGLIIYLAQGLQRHAAALHRRADLEHVIAANSTRLINSRSDETEDYVVQTLRELCACIGADRGYLVLFDDGRTTYQWCAPDIEMPEGWTEHAVNLVSMNDEGLCDVICATRTAASIKSELGRELFVKQGLLGWICVPFIQGERINGILAFDALTKVPYVSAGEVGSLRMAFNAMADALNRDRLESERSRLEKNLQHARRIETVGALASGIAHNFNNIIGAILGYTEIGLARTGRGTAIGHTLVEIRRAAERAHDVVEQILRFGRRGELHREAVAIGTLLDETESLLRATLQSRVSLSVEKNIDAEIVLGEAVQLQQVILNLSTNAAQAIDGEGSVRIAASVQETDAPQQMSHGSLPPGRYIKISVEDTGRGMSRQTLARAFDPFFTTRASGNGLGLATVREIVLDHAGALDVHSDVGRGTRIDVWLPAGSVSTGEVCPEGQLPQGRGETVLLLDLDADRLMRHEEVLAALGYEPVGFSNLSAAAQALRASPQRFDAVLICQVLAEIPKLASAFRSEVGDLPILLATTGWEGVLPDTLMRSGITEVLHLPLRSSELAKVLHRVLAKSAERSVRMAGRPEARFERSRKQSSSVTGM